MTSHVADGIRARLAAWATRRPHVLLVPVPGATRVRLAVETSVRSAGGVLASTPADADIVAVAGEPGPELRAAIERVWAQLPGPRARVELTDPAHTSDVRAAIERLADPRQAEEARVRRDEWTPGDDEHMPGGLPMAGTAEDRDGLTLDVLHVPLGPVLPDWPAGLVVDTVLQGDVVQQASPRLLGPHGAVDPPFWRAWGGLRPAAARLDSLARLLGVAGWEDAAARARRIRDELLDGAAPAQVRPAFAALRRRVQRSWALRWTTDGLGCVGGGEDATARWKRWLAEAAALLGAEPPDAAAEPRDTAAGGLPDAAGQAPARERLAAAVDAMPGLELAAARLVLASFDPDPDELAAAPAGLAGSGGGPA